MREKSMGECKTLGFRLDTGFAYSIRFPVFAVSYDDMAFICTTQTKTSANYNIEKVEDHEVWTFFVSLHSFLTPSLIYRFPQCSSIIARTKYNEMQKLQ